MGEVNPAQNNRFGPQDPARPDHGLLPEPANFEAEQVLLGSLLYDNDLVWQVQEFIDERGFFNPCHGRIFLAIKEVAGRGERADEITLKQYFDLDNGLEEVGGAAYLGDLVAMSVPSALALNYARILQDLSHRRRLKQIGDHMAQLAADSPVHLSASDQAAQGMQALLDLVEVDKSRESHIGDAGRRFLENLQHQLQDPDGKKRDAVYTGYDEIDMLSGGFDRRKIYLFAGRPGMGKSALVANIGDNIARQHHQHLAASRAGRGPGEVVFFNFEMEDTQLAARLLCWDARIDNAKLRSRQGQPGALTMEDFEALNQAEAARRDLPFHLVDAAGFTVAKMRALLMRMKMQAEARGSHIGTVIVDYFGLIQHPDSRLDVYTRASENSRMLTQMAKDLDIVLIVACQLNRNLESRQNKRPILSDLRDTGVLEQDATGVFFVYREEIYIRNEKPDEADMVAIGLWEERLLASLGKAEIIAGKMRDGQTGTIDTHYLGRFWRFLDDQDRTTLHDGELF